MSADPSIKHLCYNCFQERETQVGPCPYCGFDLAENEKKFPVALRAGTVLNGRYIIGRVLGQGGFGITYLALDTQLNAKVAIKEFMPNDIATRIGTTVSVAMDTKSEEFAYGAERFQEEARTLAKFIGNPNIAAVTSYFDENDTSYFVMDYIEGISFKTYIANHGGKISVEETLNVMIPVLRALTAVHAEGFIHRDVTPDNIYITKDGMVKLLDFGSARYSIGDKSKSLDVILKVGYAPKEQYIRRSRQGPFTDVYSCAACFYAAITGFLPPESLERMDEDTLVPISQCGIDIPEYLDKAILKGLAVQPEDRFQNAAEFLDAIESQQVVEVPVSGGNTASLTLEKKKAKPALIAAIAAAVVVVLGIGIAIGGGGRTTVDADGETVQLIQAEVPSITIAGQEYSTDLTELDLSNQGLTNTEIQDLHYMVNLTKLNLENNPDLTDLSPLEELPNLTSLTFGHFGLTNLDALSGLTGLNTLNVKANLPLNDIGALKNLTSLHTLVIDRADGNAPGPAVKDLSSLSNLVNLEKMTFNVAEISSFDWAKNLVNLKTLECYSMDAAFTDLDALSALTNLQTLRLPDRVYGYTELYDIQGLSDLTELISLEIPVGVEDLAPLANLTSLESLTISGGISVTGEFTSLEPLENLTNLTSLFLSMNGHESQSIDLSPLASLTNLQSLTIQARDFEYDPVVPSLVNLSALSNLTNLQNLDLTVSDVVDISPLRNLTNLQSVTISEYGSQKITDWSPVEHVPNVTKS